MRRKRKEKGKAKLKDSFDSSRKGLSKDDAYFEAIRTTPETSYDHPRRPPPSTAPPLNAFLTDDEYADQRLAQKVSDQFVDTRDASNTKSRKKRKKSLKKKVPKGYVSITRTQRIYAAFGFLWVAVGLALTTAAAAVVFVGQRERYKNAAVALGNGNEDREDWKAWVFPIFTGLIVAVVYGVLCITTTVKFIRTVVAKGREIDTPTPSASGRSDTRSGPRSEGNSVGALEEVEVIFEEELRYPSAPPIAVVPGEARMKDNLYYGAPLPYQPDEQTVKRLMRQLRDMGYRNPHQTLAALQASSFDLERASEKLANSQV